MSEQHDTDTAGGALPRREFIRKGTVAPLAAMLGAVAIPAEPVTRRRAARRDRAQREPVECGIIGYGEWGREIAATLGRIGNAHVASIADTFPVMLERARRSLPDASAHADARALLDDPKIRAVFIATPTHLHRDLVLAALQAGKHVYCEAPLAHTVEDARAIADAAKAASAQVFQAGLKYRTEPQHRGVFQFIRSGAIGRPAGARAQWHRKTSWRRASATPDRARELNWRLDTAVSTGLVGEIGIHQLDSAAWIFTGLPVAVSGQGQVMQWRDGREVADTIQAIFEYESGARLTYTATLANSFDGEYNLYYGSDGTVMMRDAKGWLFKEVDAPLLGWEVYARKDRFYREEGVALVADATKLAAQGIDPTKDDPNAETPLFHALDEFVDNVLNGPFPPAAGYKQGYDATVLALQANGAIVKNTRVVLDPALFAAVS